MNINLFFTNIDIEKKNRWEKKKRWKKEWEDVERKNKKNKESGKNEK